jgi:VanZ family protein
MDSLCLVEKKRGRVNRYAPFLVWATLIFLFSSSTGSAENTSRFIRPLLELIFFSASSEFIDSIHFLIRKSAHFIFYGILALLALRAFIGSSRKILSSAPIAATVLSVLVIAILDELNQSINPSRTGSLQDVLLDLAGAVFFLLAVFLVGRIRKV